MHSITWKSGGKQYVGVYSGNGGWIGLPVPPVSTSATSSGPSALPR